MSVPVEFLRDNPPYRTGERATFTPERAETLVAAGAARWPADATGDLLGETGASDVNARKKTTTVRRGIVR